jgi:hypothetical protein
VNNTTFNDVIACIESTAKSLTVLSEGKGREYCNDSADGLANLRSAAHKLNLNMETVCLVYLNKHITSIETYVRRMQEGKETPKLAEPIQGRINDAILYLILMKCIIHEQRLNPCKNTSLENAAKQGYVGLKLNYGENDG